MFANRFVCIYFHFTRNPPALCYCSQLFVLCYSGGSWENCRLIIISRNRSAAQCCRWCCRCPAFHLLLCSMCELLAASRKGVIIKSIFVVDQKFIFTVRWHSPAVGIFFSFFLMQTKTFQGWK